jgi:O-antigen/teichoic acid export membrane protein
VIAFAAGLSTIMIPRLISNDALDELRARSTRLMHTCYPLVAVIMLFSPFLFEFFFGPVYKQSAIIFNIYLLLTLTQLVFPQAILTARSDTRRLWYVSLAELAVNVAASLILLSYFGLAGIAWGTFIAFVFEKVVLLFMVEKRYGIKPVKLINPYVWFGYVMILSVSFIAAKWIFGI